MKWETYIHNKTGVVIIVVYGKMLNPSYIRTFNSIDSKDFVYLRNMLRNKIDIAKMDKQYNLVNHVWFDAIAFAKMLIRPAFMILEDEKCDYELLRNFVQKVET